jgi:hypothetical protein
MHAPQSANNAVNRSPSSTISPAGRRLGADATRSGDLGQATNGTDGALRTNGDQGTCEPSSTVKLMSRTDKDIIRLIGQHLQTIGLTYATAMSIVQSIVVMITCVLPKPRKYWKHAERGLKLVVVSCLGVCNTSQATAVYSVGDY